MKSSYAKKKKRMYLDASKSSFFLRLGEFLALALVLLGLFWGIQWLWTSFFTQRFRVGPTAVDIADLWEREEYAEATELIERDLLEKPFSLELLVSGGISSFYASLGQTSFVDKARYLDRAILLLRRALIFPSVPLLPNVYYALGQAYYHKGHFFFHLSKRYLEAAYALSPDLPHLSEYLALTYGTLGEYEKSIEAFLRVDSYQSSPLVLLGLARASFHLKRLEKAREYLFNVLYWQGEKAIEENILQQAWLLLGELELSLQRYDEAYQAFEKTLEVNPLSAVVYLRMGDIYSMRDRDDILARKYWRQALELDPSNKEALSRLNQSTQLGQ